MTSTTTPWLTDNASIDTATHLKPLITTMTETCNAHNFSPVFWEPLIHRDYQDHSNTWFNGLRGPEVFAVALRAFMAERPDLQVLTIDIIVDVDEKKGAAQMAQHTQILGSETATPSITTWELKRDKRTLAWQAKSMTGVFGVWRDAGCGSIVIVLSFWQAEADLSIREFDSLQGDIGSEPERQSSSMCKRVFSMIQHRRPRTRNTHVWEAADIKAITLRIVERSIYSHAFLSFPNSLALLGVVGVERHNIRRIVVRDSTSRAEVSNFLASFLHKIGKACSRTALKRSIITPRQSLWTLVDQHTVVGRICCILVSVPCGAIHLLHGDVCQEWQDVGADPLTVVVDLGGWHGSVDIVGAGHGGVVEESHRYENCWWEFAMGEGYVDILVVGAVRRKQVCCRVEPREPDSTRHWVAIAGIVMIHQVLCVLELQPFVWTEEIQGAEWRAATDNSIVTTPLLHTDHVVGCPFESRCLGTQAGEDWCSVALSVGLTLRRAARRRIRWARLVWCQTVRASLFAFVDLHKLNLVLFHLNATDQSLSAHHCTLCCTGPNSFRQTEIWVPEAHLHTQL